ncbi:hypothetical protein [uncultured Alistipes sp.]|uniref:hypothetical protein n=1 Tax=uncultured Alistipes sp. TaxID=538949 RepID=UPI00272F0D19|nr:hypothetical protein [uncultured Alistipes sp.]
MQFTKSILLATAAIMACACEKEIATTEAPQSAESSEIVCIDGTLHFPSAESCLTTMNGLTSEDALAAFEKQYNFHSVRSLTESMLDELIECETPEEYRAIFETCTDYLKEEDGRLMPVITSVGYASIADTDGVFYVDDVKHTVCGDKILVETHDPVTRAATTQAIDYIAPWKLASDTRADSEQKYTDKKYQSGKYKVFARTNVLRHVVAHNQNGRTIYTSEFAVQVHVSGQKKKVLIGWNTYKEHFYVENLHFDINIGNQAIAFETYRNTFFAQSDGKVKNFYVTIPYGTGYFSGPIIVPMPQNLNCIVHRARSNGTGNCGVLTDINCCFHTPLALLTECK